MKFKSWVRGYGYLYFVLILISFAVCLIGTIGPPSWTLKCINAIMFYPIPVFGIYYLHKELWVKFYATIYISPEEIIWECPFRKTICLDTTRCYIGVETDCTGLKGNTFIYPYIYFSLKTYPREYENKIDKLPCSDEFIKFRYDPEIAEYILKTLPKEQTKRLDYFHYMYMRDNKK